jgi:hypothetical protein
MCSTTYQRASSGGFPPGPIVSWLALFVTEHLARSKNGVNPTERIGALSERLFAPPQVASRRVSYSKMSAISNVFKCPKWYVILG